MAAISKIKIDGFKAFPQEFKLNLDGKNPKLNLKIWK